MLPSASLARVSWLGFQCQAHLLPADGLYVVRQLLVASSMGVPLPARLPTPCHAGELLCFTDVAFVLNCSIVFLP